MRGISDRKKRDIIDLYLQGLTRDENAQRTCVSAGSVSKVIKDFTDCADSSSVSEGAEEYSVIDTVEGLRGLAVEMRKAGTSVEELMRLSGILKRVKKLTDLDRLEKFIKAGKSLGDKAHVEAAMKMHTIEQQTGKSHDEIVADLERKVAKHNKLTQKIPHLNSELKKLNSEKKREEADFKARRSKLNAELRMHLKQHNLTIEKVEHVSKIEKDLGEYGVKLNQLEDVQRILNAVQESGDDPQRLVEFVKSVESLRTQTEAETRNLTETREKKAKLCEEVLALEKKLNEAKLVIEKCRKLESMGWCSENLERAINLAKEAGSVDEALSRLELLKPSAELRADLDNIKAETADAASRKRKLTKSYDALKKRFRNFEDATNAMMDLFKMGFTQRTLLSIQDIALKYGSFPIFIEAFGRYKHLKKIETEIKRLEKKREAVKDDLERMQRETRKLDAKKEDVALKTGRLEAEIEQMMKIISGLKFYTVFADDPRSLTIDSAAWFIERIRIWAENKQIEVEKKTFLTSELKVGDISRRLCESIRKLRERGH